MRQTVHIRGDQKHGHLTYACEFNDEYIDLLIDFMEYLDILDEKGNKIGKN